MEKNIACKSFIDFGGSSIKNRRGQMFFFLFLFSPFQAQLQKHLMNVDLVEKGERDRQTDGEREKKRCTEKARSVSFFSVPNKHKT